MGCGIFSTFLKKNFCYNSEFSICWEKTLFHSFFNVSGMRCTEGIGWAFHYLSEKMKIKKNVAKFVKFAIKLSVVYIFIPLNLVVFVIIVVVMKFLAYALEK